MPFTHEIETSTMTPEKWAMLNRAITPEEYRVMVIDYQRREFERLPKCKTLFGVCRYWASGRCTNKERCASKGN